MKTIALTGSIGMGKTTVAAMFAKSGIPVFDADAVVRRLQERDPDLIAAIGARFPGTVTGGVLDRDALSARVIADRAELAALESIVHPAVQQARAQFLETHRDAPALLFDIPLLFETNGQDAFDVVIVVSAPAEIQRARVLRRHGMTWEKLRGILARQMTDEEKRRRADFIIETGTDLSTTKAQVDAIIACLDLGRGR